MSPRKDFSGLTSLMFLRELGHYCGLVSGPSFCLGAAVFLSVVIGGGGLRLPTRHKAKSVVSWLLAAVSLCSFCC